MISYELGVFATAITGVLIFAILAIYLSVLKKNGWILNAASPQSQVDPAEKASLKPLENSPTLNEGIQEPEEIKALVAAVQEDKMDPVLDEKKIALKHKLAEKLIEAQKSSKVRNVSSRCINYFGYLYTLEKTADIPDGCFSCSKLIQCFKQPER